MIKKWKASYVRWHTDRIRLPDFTPSETIRIHARFRGKVQRVGFREEMRGLALRLGLTGTVRNLPDESVEAELQGERDMIDFLIGALRSLKRARMEDVQVREMDLIVAEEHFVVLDK